MGELAGLHRDREAQHGQQAAPYRQTPGIITPQESHQRYEDEMGPATIALHINDTALLALTF